MTSPLVFDRLGGMGIGVSDLKRSVDFYTRVLGWEVRSDTTMDEWACRWLVVGPPGQDDVGLALSRAGWPPVRALGRALVVGMPPFLRVLSVVGTAAMIWVGGGILLHGLEVLGLPGPAHAAHALAAAAAGAVPAGKAVVEWLVGAAVSGVVGLAVGAAAIPVAQRVIAPLLRLVRP